MDFTRTEEQTLMVEAARKVGERFGLDYWRRIDEEQRFPSEMWKAIAQAGLCGVALPESAGGSGLGMLDLAMVIETLCATGAGATLGQVFMINPIFGGVSISKYGQPWMKEQLLPRLITGDLNFCMALTEPDAGSNTLEMRAQARAEGQGWRIKGQKIWITAVPDAGYMLVVARTRPYDPKRRADGISLFMVPTDRAGLSFTKIPKLGTHTLSSCNVFFDDMRVEPEELVGTENDGWRALLDVLNTERIVTTAGLVGTTELAIRLAVDYAKDRKVFGDRPIAAYQALQFPLAQCHAENEAARLLNHRAASRFDTGQSYGSDVNHAKLLAAQTCAKATERAMQTMGGMGFAKDMHAERLWRDSRLFKFAPVSEEMVLNYISMHDLGLVRGY